MGFKFNKNTNFDHKKINYAPAKRHLAKWQWYLLVIIILSPLLYFLGKIFINEFVVTAPGYLYYDKTVVRASENGYIDKILVNEGGYVKSGQRLIRISSPMINETLKHLKKELESLKNLKLNTKNPEITHFIRMKEKLQKHLVKTIEYVNAMEYLRNKKLSTITDVQKARVDLKDIELQLGEIDRKIAESNLNHKFKLENQYGKVIRELRGEIVKLETSLGLLNITSPQNGTVAKIFTNEDEYVLKGQSLMEVMTHKNLRVKAYLDHKSMSDDIHQGREVTIILPENIKLKGKIAQIPSLAELQNQHLNIIELKNNNKVLLIISLLEKLPSKYQISGLPVKVVINDYGLSFLN